jgi:catechol-2,3-dioxygenase
VNIILRCIILFVNNVDLLKHFYVQNFGLEPIEEIKSEWVLLKAGACELALHKIGAAYAQKQPGHHTNAKIVFEVNEDIFAVHKQLTERGVDIKGIQTWDNFDYWVCDGNDPEGNVFQLRIRK